MTRALHESLLCRYDGKTTLGAAKQCRQQTSQNLACQCPNQKFCHREHGVVMKKIGAEDDLGNFEKIFKCEGEWENISFSLYKSQ